LQEVYSLEEMAELLASLNPETIQVISRLLKTNLELGIAAREHNDMKQVRLYSSA
jgi:hypothetical protein